MSATATVGTRVPRVNGKSIAALLLVLGICLAQDGCLTNSDPGNGGAAPGGGHFFTGLFRKH